MRLHHPRPQPALRSLRGVIVCGYASRDRAKADEYRRRYDGVTAYGDYAAAIDDPRDRRRRRRRAAALPSRPDAAGARGRQARAGREAGVPADGGLRDGRSRRATAAGRVVLVGENDHYKPLAVTPAAAAGRRRRSARWCSRTSRRIAQRLKTADDWRNDEAMAGGDAFFEEGIHWLHLAGSLGPRITIDPRLPAGRRRATGPTAAPRA